jgi:hypothetical protein
MPRNTSRHGHVGLSSDTLAAGAAPVNGTVVVAGRRDLLAALVRFTATRTSAGERRAIAKSQLQACSCLQATLALEWPLPPGLLAHRLGH